MAYPWSKLPKKQLEVFQHIATGMDGCHHPRTLKALEDKGLIVATKRVMGGTFPVTITFYSVPYAIHYDWCQWCSEQYLKEDLEEDQKG